MAFKRIVLAVDGSPPSERAVTVSAALAAAVREAEAVGAALLARAAEALQARGVSVATRHARGPVGRRVVETANEMDADLIVVGSHGHGRLEELLLGSVSDAVARQARCSVLIVR